MKRPGEHVDGYLAAMAIVGGVLGWSAGVTVRAANAQVVEFSEEDPVQANNAEMIERQQFQIPDNWFEGQLMGGGGRPGIAATLRESLQLRIDAIDRVCVLSESQREKLAFAAQGDLHRFLRRVEEVKERGRELRLKLEPFDQQKYQQFWQEAWPMVQPLQKQIQLGIYGSDSLFAKVVHSTLTPEQQTQFELEQQEQVRFRYHAMIDKTVADINDRVPMTDANRKVLVGLLRALPAPTALSGGSGMEDYYMLWKLSQLPEADLRPLFSDRDWRLLKGACGMVSGMAPQMRAQFEPATR